MATRLDVHDGAGQGPGDAWHALNLRYYEPTEVVDILSRGTNDDVIWPGYIVSLGYAVDQCDGRCYIGGFPDLSLDEDISLDHNRPPVVSVPVTLP